MKQKLCRTLILTLLLMVGSVAQARNLPEQITQDFYAWYLGSMEKSVGYEKWHLPQMEKHVDRDLLNVLREAFKEPEIGCLNAADYFLKAQDFPDEWTTHIRVKRLFIDNDIAGVSVTLGSQPGYQLMVCLRKDNGTWKIFHVFSLQKEE
jgi:hypothetical protein